MQRSRRCVRRARARGGSAYVTLEPCCHQGKTGPCTEALISAGVRRVVCAMRDPFEAVAGRGIAALEAAGVSVETGMMEEESRRINAPYLKLVTTGQPWVIVKWAMTLDGKIATHTGDSRWISGEASRAIVQQLRGRVDAIVVGRHTSEKDDPLLTVRRKGARVATRIVVDSLASLRLDSQLVRTAGQAPVLIAVGAGASQDKIDRLTSTGCEVIVCRTTKTTGSGENAASRVSIEALLLELGRRKMTNVLVEGGGELLGSLFDIGAIDEAHVFIAPILIGGRDAPTAMAGVGFGKDGCCPKDCRTGRAPCWRRSVCSRPTEFATEELLGRRDPCAGRRWGYRFSRLHQSILAPRLSVQY